jgi:hypothetical protein
MEKQEILRKLASGELQVEDASKMLEEINTPRRGLYCKVSPKGAMSVYGLQRMPVTLYVEQWERLLDFAPELKQFMTDHAGQLKRKENAKAPE